VLGKFQIENELRDAARAHRTRHLRRVPDIDDDAEQRASAGIGDAGFGPPRWRCGGGERGCTKQKA
jgi:hypothetical protein